MAGSELDTRFRSAGDSPGLRLWQVTNRWQAVMRAALLPHGLTHVQYVLLASLLWLEGVAPDEPPTQARLAEFAATDVMMTSQVARALATKGWIERRSHPSDGRARVLRVTGGGRLVANAATVDVERADAAFFSALDGPDAFLAELVRLSGRSDRVPPRVPEP